MFAAKPVIICRKTLGRLLQRSETLGSLDVDGKSSNNFPHDFVLNGEDVPDISVKAFRPKVFAGGCFNQLRRDPDLSADASHTSFKNILNPQIPSDVLHVDCTVLVGKGRSSRDYT